MKCYACKLKVIQLNHLQPFKILNDIGLFVSTKTRLLSCTVNKVGKKEKHDKFHSCVCLTCSFQNKENQKIFFFSVSEKKMIWKGNENSLVIFY